LRLRRCERRVGYTWPCSGVQDRRRHRAAECLRRGAAEASPAAAAKITSDQTPRPPEWGGGDGFEGKRSSSWARHISANTAAVKDSQALCAIKATGATAKS